MRLSEAMRGFKRVVSKTGAVRPGDPFWTAAEAVGIPPRFSAIYERWPWLKRNPNCNKHGCTCETGKPPDELLALAHMYDVHVVRNREMSIRRFLQLVKDEEAVYYRFPDPKQAETKVAL